MYFRGSWCDSGVGSYGTKNNGCSKIRKMILIERCYMAVISSLFKCVERCTHDGGGAAAVERSKIQDPSPQEIFKLLSA